MLNVKEKQRVCKTNHERRTPELTRAALFHRLEELTEDLYKASKLASPSEKKELYRVHMAVLTVLTISEYAHKNGLETRVMLMGDMRRVDGFSFCWHGDDAGDSGVI